MILPPGYLSPLHPSVTMCVVPGLLLSHSNAITIPIATVGELSGLGFTSVRTFMGIFRLRCCGGASQSQ